MASAKDIFLDALEREGPERSAFVDEACAGDAELRARVQKLLDAHTRAEEVLPDEVVAPSKTSTGSFQAGTRVGSYRLIRPIGEGGFGTVWIAEQEGAIRRRAAIKILKAGLDTTEVVARFEAERQALALMEHPSIASVFEGGATDSGRPWFAMEFVDGVPLTRYCESRSLTTEERIDLFLKVCRAIQHAHQKGIIHRDLKPTNVLVAELDGVPTPKVIDFGIAKAVEERLTDRTLKTRAGAFLGTPTYMSPEQVSEVTDIDTRSDVYSLGVLLYELLCGEPPFNEEMLQSASLFEIQRIIRESEPTRPSQRIVQLARSGTDADTARLRDVRGDLDWIVMRCLEKDRERRYDSVAVLANDLERHLRGETVLAGPPDLRYRFTKFTRRHRAAISMGLAILILVVTGAVIATAQAVRATRAERLARDEAEHALNAERLAREEAERATAAEVLAREEALRATEAERVARDEAQRATAAEGLAREEAERARTELGKYERIALFLQDMFHSVDPSVAKGRDTTLLNLVLDRAERRVDKEAGNPEVEAALRYTIGLAFFSTSDYRRALPHLERAASLREEHSGASSQDTLDALNDLATLYMALGRHDDAEPLLERVLEGRTDSLGQDNAATLATIDTLAVLRKRQNKLEEAEALFRMAEEGYRKLRGPDDLDTIRVSSNLAGVLQELGQTEEAAGRLQRALDVQIVQLGPKDPRTLKAMNNLADLLLGTGELEEATALLERTIEIKKLVLEPGHPSLLVSLNNLASAYRKLKRYEESEELFRQAIELARSTGGERSEMTTGLIHNLGTLLAENGRPEEAAELLSRSWEVYRERYGDEHPRVLASKATFAMSLCEGGNHDEGIALLREVIAIAPRVFPAASSSPGTYWINLGKCLRADGQNEPALEAFAQGYEIVDARGDEHERARAVEKLTELLEELGRHDEAEAWRLRLSQAE